MYVALDFLVVILTVRVKKNSKKRQIQSIFKIKSITFLFLSKQAEITQTLIWCRIYYNELFPFDFSGHLFDVEIAVQKQNIVHFIWL